MKLFLTSAYSSHHCLDRLVELAGTDQSGAHHLVAEPETADAILFVENTQFLDLRFQGLLNHPLVRAFPDKVFMYNEMDEAWPILPGLYCSLASRFTRTANHIAFPYLTASNQDIQFIHNCPVERRWLFSFVGSSSHPIRRQILELPQADARIVDTSDFCAWDPLQTSAHAYQKLYVDTMAASRFVLCPRGIGPASLRLYETIEAGRVPVIISDYWVAPPQINWDFAVRVPESEIRSIPDTLRALEGEWKDRSQAAREQWERAYSPGVLFETVGDAVEQLQETARRRNTLSLAVELHKARVIIEHSIRRRLKGQSGQAAGEKRQQPTSVSQQVSG